MPYTPHGNHYTVRKHRRLAQTWNVQAGGTTVGTIVQRQVGHHLEWQGWTQGGFQAGDWRRRRNDAVDDILTTNKRGPLERGRIAGEQTSNPHPYDYAINDRIEIETPKGTCRARVTRTNGTCVTVTYTDPKPAGGTWTFDATDPGYTIRHLGRRRA
jgi:hypothetical protein